MADDVRVHDGRFGERFDAEVDSIGIGKLAIGFAGVCVLGMLITWGMVRLWAARAEAAQPPPSPVAEARERQLPPGPQLQKDPEGELIEMRRELSARLNGYGWVDEAAGVVHIPIDRAIELLVSEGTGAAPTPATPAPDTEPAPAMVPGEAEPVAAAGETGGGAP